MRTFGHRRRRRKGFTLTELVISVAILGVLASIAIPGYNRAICQARQGEGKRALTNLRRDLLACMQTIRNTQDSTDCINSATLRPMLQNHPYYDFTVNYTTKDLSPGATDPQPVLATFSVTGIARTPLMAGAALDQILITHDLPVVQTVDSCRQALPGSSSGSTSGGTTSSSGSTSGSTSSSGGSSSSSSGCGCGCGCGALVVHKS